MRTIHLIGTEVRLRDSAREAVFWKVTKKDWAGLRNTTGRITDGTQFRNPYTKRTTVRCLVEFPDATKAWVDLDHLILTGLSVVV